MHWYLLYYLATLLASYGAQNPWLLVLLLGFVALRDRLPDPYVLARAFVGLGKLKGRIRRNPADLPARRDLGRLYLDLYRPRAAAKVLAEARERDSRDPELAELHGTALLRVGDAEGALEALGRAAGVNSVGELSSRKTEGGGNWGRSAARTSQIMLLAAEALQRLGRTEQAEEALSAAAEFNSSTLAPWVRLAALRLDRGDRVGAKEALDTVKRTWTDLPAFARRHQWGWRLRAFWQAFFV